jgi:hypothetical protein
MVTFCLREVCGECLRSCTRDRRLGICFATPWLCQIDCRCDDVDEVALAFLTILQLLQATVMQSSDFSLLS